MDIFHNLFLIARRQDLHRVKIQNSKDTRILDLGTGTGIWAIDMAEYVRCTSKLRLCDADVVRTASILTQRFVLIVSQLTRLKLSCAKVVGIDLANIQPRRYAH